MESSSGCNGEARGLALSLQACPTLTLLARWGWETACSRWAPQGSTENACWRQGGKPLSLKGTLRGEPGPFVPRAGSAQKPA